MEKAVVVGGSGFVGSHVADHLSNAGYQVTIYDKNSSQWLRNDQEIMFGDVKDFEKLNEAIVGSEVVFNFAALSDLNLALEKPLDTININIIGNLNVMESCRKHGVKRFIYAASSSCYGIPDVYPTPENAEMRPQYPYALTKRLGEELVMHWAQVYKFPALSLRFFNVYGTRSRTSGTYGAVFGVFLAQKLANQPLTIVGDGKQTRDFTYVADVVRALVAAAKSERFCDIYNVGSGQTISVNRLIELLDEPTINIPKRPGEPDCTFADIDKIKEELDWEPKVSIEDGVAEVIKNIDYWRDAPVWVPESIATATQDWFKYLGDDQ